MRDSSLYVRKAVVAAQKAHAGVSAIVGDRAYGPKPPALPTWPFTRYGVSIAQPRRATGLKGNIIDFVVHAFAKGEDETTVMELADQVVLCLDGRTMPLGTSYPAKLQDISWVSTVPIQDSEEATGWHAAVRFEARVSS